VGSRAAEQQHVYERRPGDACAALPPGYHRREPEKTVLYRAVHAHLATFLAELREADERGLPQYIRQSLQRDTSKLARPLGEARRKPRSNLGAGSAAS
jgi:hypothetical protein